MKLEGLRKWTIAVLALVLATGLTALDQLESSHYRDCLIAVLGLFGWANYGEHKEKKNGHGAHGD